MIKFQDLQKEDYEPIIDSFDNSQVHDWFKDWILQGVEKHPKQDVSQSSFQKYLNTRENVSEDCTAYNILKKFKREKNYELLKKIRLQAPKESVEKVEEKAKTPELDLSEVQLAEAPKIITPIQPQTIVHDEYKEMPDEPVILEKKSKSGWIIFGLIIALIIVGAVIGACN